MTKEQAIEKAKEQYSEIWDCDINHPKYEDTVEEIVTGVIRLIMQPTFDDCVSRQAVLDLVNAECVDLQDGSETWRSCVNDTVENIYHGVKALPPVTPTFPKGATNGDVMLAIFKEIQHYSDGKICANWWNAPYKRGGEDGSN